MARSKSSQEWLQEHFSDPYVKKAQAAGYRSRAAFKLIELQEKDKLFKPGMVVVDLGAAPGGWTQLLVDWVGRKGQVFALDILPMDPFEGVTIIEGDFCEADTLDILQQSLNGQLVDLVISDMAPNISGLKAVDQPRAMYLAELALAFAEQFLVPGGSFLVKAFHGAGFDEFLQTTRRSFEKVVVRKPKASRPRSREVYIVAKGYRRDEL